MVDCEYSRKTCLQWGLRVLEPVKYYELLKRYTKKLSPFALERIRKAHEENSDGYWWWKSLPCYIMSEKRWFNVGTARWISDYCSERIGIFSSWSQYEKFREALREATEKHFSSQPNSRPTAD